MDNRESREGRTKRIGNKKALWSRFCATILSSVGVIFVLGFFAFANAAESPSVAIKNIKDAQYVGTETCATCHEKENKEFELSTHARIKVKGVKEEAEGCEMCHGAGSIHVDNGGGRNKPGQETIMNPRKNPEVCFTCHMEKKMEFRLPYHHPVLEGKMSCADCHNLHGTDARPWTSTSIDDTNEVCFKCHKEQRGPFVWQHQALRDGCTTCHKVHGAITDKMLVTRDANLCLRCHITTNFPTIGTVSHSTRTTQGTCWSASCHTAPHGSYFDRHFRE